MLQKWKHIINNWINCYFDENKQDERNMNIECLLNIISHLRENLNLDESKSSVLEAHTVEEFILEKYPGFKFENGSIIARSEDDIYLVASLLLFFVCVNSKDVDIKTAMCSKLSGADQEIILNFSKSLMVCSHTITYKDVQTAITDACGVDMPVTDMSQPHATVAETPPALRSLHGEVRRLQAALDAERFDRNYLQEELARTNLRVEKLVKDKEQYKLDIMNLKAKISLCCGGEHDARGSDAGGEETAKLARQLEETEERLVQTQELLDDAVHDKCTLKAKVDELKQDRDKWLALSQQESSRAIQLAEELEVERRQMQSLRELVTELRQHNRLNRLDSSQLECDDPDASLHSLVHNLSVCSEACANVIEVQLSEEKAKVDALKLQIETLQKENEQLHFAIEEDNSNHEVIITQKDSVIDDLEQQLKKKTGLLESLRKDHEDLTLLWETHKIKTKEIMDEKDAQMMRLNEEFGALQQEYAILESVKDKLVLTIDEMVKEASETERQHKEELGVLVKSIAQLESKCTAIATEKEVLQKEKDSAIHNLEQQLKETIILLESVKKGHEDVTVLWEQHKLNTKGILEEKDEQILKLNKELISLQQEVAALECVKEKLVLRIDDMVKEIENTKNKYKEEIDTLVDALAQEESKCAAIANEKEFLRKEKDYVINDLEQQLQETVDIIESVKKEREEETMLWETHKLKSKEIIDEKDEQLMSLHEKLDALQQEFADLVTVKEDITKKMDVLVKKAEDSENKFREEIEKLIDSRVQEQAKYVTVTNEKEMMQKEKDAVIADLEQKLEEQIVLVESLKKETDDMNLSWEYYKITTKKVIDEKEAEINKLNVDLESLHKINVDLESVRDEMVKENDALLEQAAEIESKYKCEIEHLVQSLAQEETKYAIVTNEKEILLSQLMEEKAAKDVLQSENSRQEEDYKVLVANNHTLLDEKMILAQQLSEEKSLRQILEEQKNVLSSQNTTIEKKFIKQVKNMEKRIAKEAAKTKAVSDDKERLTQQLIEERSAKELAEKVKENLLIEKQSLEHSLASLQNEKQEINAQVKELMEKQCYLEQEYTKEKAINESLSDEKRHLVQELTEEKFSKDVLYKEKEDLVTQNKSLKHELVDQKTVQEVLLSDKELLLAEKHSLMESLGTEKSSLDEVEHEKNELSVQLNDLIRKYTAEVSSLQAKLNKVVEEKQQLRAKFEEKSKQVEVFATQLENQQREMQLIQKDNQSLTNDLNDVKVQLEVKVHSLKEKLVDNENLTDKLKKTYENQIDNLNIMVTKLTNYLKDKTSELDVARKEKDRLQQLVEENNQAIKSLEEELKTIKQNEQKLIYDFDSERQVLKNMVTVTESVMEDQKVTLNNAIVEQTKANEILVEENKCLKEEIERERKDLMIKLEEKETVLEMTFKQLAELKLVKEEIEKEVKSHKEVLDYEIMSLKEEVQKREEEVEKLRKENNLLEIQILSYKEDVVSMEKQTSEAKIKLDANEVEFRSKVDKLTESLNEQMENKKDLSGELEEKTKYITEMENKLTKLELKINSLEDEKIVLTQEKDNYVFKVNEIQDMFNTNSHKNAEEITKLKEDNSKMEDKIIKLNNDKTELSEEISKFKRDNADLTEEINKLRKEISEHLMDIDKLKKDNLELGEEIGKYKKENAALLEETNKLKNESKEFTEGIGKLEKDSTELKEEIDKYKRDTTDLVEEVNKFRKEATESSNEIQKLKNENKELADAIDKYKNVNKEFTVEVGKLRTVNTELNDEINKLRKDNIASEEEINKLRKDCSESSDKNSKLKEDIMEIEGQLNKLKKENSEMERQLGRVKEENLELEERLEKLKRDNFELDGQLDKLKKENAELTEEISKLKKDNMELNGAITEKESVIINLEQNIKEQQDKYQKLCDDTATEKVTLVNKCDILQDYHSKAEKELEERQREITSLQKEVQTLTAKVEVCEEDSKAKDGFISKMSKEKDVIINNVNKELLEERIVREQCQKDIEEKVATINQLRQNLNQLSIEREALNILKKENEELIKAVGQRETFAVRSQENTSSQKYSGQVADRELRDLHHQVDNTSDITHSSMESLKTISDLERIIHDKNRTITTLQSDVSYLKTLMAESETKLLDVTKELEVSKENCHQLSTQLKKIVHQKNEEIAELKKQVNKMSATETRATQIIKVSAKYQAIILKRIAEIKSNTVLKELTNFGNSNNNNDNELRRSLTAGSITMEDLENFLETTERHLKKCTEKQIALQKERDRLTEVNRINESEIINLKKFLTELSVSFQTFNSVKELYAQKLSRVVSVQRTVRREILSLDGHVADACMMRLERGYAAVMQDLAECAMNLQRWAERCVGRTVSCEKIKQAFLDGTERTSLAPSSVQNAALEVQLDELDNSFQKLLEDVTRARSGEGARDSQAATVLEVRAEYEDKLNRMKAKMKQLYTEQIAVFKEKQKEEIAMLERELARARDKLAQSSRAYEEHIRGLTAELWAVGERFLRQKDEAEWLRRKQRSGSLMSLQQVHSSGLVPPQEDPGRPSDTHSLRSLPVNTNATKREGRGLHMSDEEGEVFDNRWLKELSATPRRDSALPPGQRLSELRWRNSLCPPHLKSSYPAETQFTHALDEDEIKAMGATGAGVATRQQRKEVGITAYKKPGPPTPSKQAGRLSATDSELRESLRVEAEPQPSRKTSTPSRIRSLFRSSKTETTEGTPRSRRLSNIFRKK